MADTTADAPVHGWRFWGFLVLMLALMALFIGSASGRCERLAEKER